MTVASDAHGITVIFTTVLPNTRGRSNGSGHAHVLFPFTNTVVAGSYVSASILVKEIARRKDWRVTVCLPLAGDNLRLFEDSGASVRFLGLRQEELERGRKLRLRSQLLYRAKITCLATVTLLATRPDLVHVNDDLTLLTWGPAARLLGIPLVWHVRQERPTRFDPLFTRLASKSILIARSTARRFGGSPPPHSTVAHNVTDLGRFRPPEDRSEAKRKLGLPGNALVAGFVGRLHSAKRPEWAVRAALGLQSRYPDLHLLLAGPEIEDGLECALRRLAEQGDASRIHLLGPRSDIPEVMQALDLLLLPSRSEPFGLVAIEAMATGVPVVATRAGGIPEIIEDGVTGRLVNADSYLAFQGAVEELILNQTLRDTFSTAALEVVSSRFAPERICSQVLEAYSGLLN